MFSTFGANLTTMRTIGRIVTAMIATVVAQGVVAHIVRSLDGTEYVAGVCAGVTGLIATLAVFYLTDDE